MGVGNVFLVAGIVWLLKFMRNTFRPPTTKGWLLFSGLIAVLPFLNIFFCLGFQSGWDHRIGRRFFHCTHCDLVFCFTVDDCRRISGSDPGFFPGSYERYCAGVGPNALDRHHSGNLTDLSGLYVHDQAGFPFKALLIHTPPYRCCINPYSICGDHSSVCADFCQRNIGFTHGFYNRQVMVVLGGVGC